MLYILRHHIKTMLSVIQASQSISGRHLLQHDFPFLHRINIINQSIHPLVRKFIQTKGINRNLEPIFPSLIFTAVLYRNILILWQIANGFQREKVQKPLSVLLYYPFIGNFPNRLIIVGSKNSGFLHPFFQAIICHEEILVHINSNIINRIPNKIAHQIVVVLLLLLINLLIRNISPGAHSIFWNTISISHRLSRKGYPD